MTRRLPALFALGAAALLALAACTTSEPGEDALPSGEAPTAAPGDEAAEAELACDTIIRPELVEQLYGLGWDVLEETFMIGPTEIDGGIQCKWGDFETTNESLQLYGWAPIPPADAEAAQTELADQGWLREDEGDTVYLTENPEFVMFPDEEGYGVTYRFGDGWVTLSDTKAGLAAVHGPR